jgi:hypothetical protein
MYEDELDEKYIVLSIFNKKMVASVSKAVSRTAEKTGLS